LPGLPEIMLAEVAELNAKNSIALFYYLKLNLQQ